MNGEQPIPSARERDIFLEALDQPNPEARAVYLQHACGADHTLRKSVETLLSNFKNDNFLEIPALTMRRSNVATEKPGDYIGHYKLVQKIGEGGWGVVYKAEQEEPFRRSVALKIIRIGMDTPHVIARFEVERQALAMMEHPNIAKVFDASATDQGRPYFVMELVTGIPITQYCDEQKLSVSERLELFVPVCQAIQHAHEKGIVHRDIKPGNVLVVRFDGRPVPKVIDFGIAKATQPLTDKPLVTAEGQFLGTLGYMSPEQAGLDSQGVDARSDVYSLGVLLYELLVGRPPFPSSLPNDEMLRVIREKEPLIPSVQFGAMTKEKRAQIAQCRQTTPSSLLQTLRGELDCVVMKCLEKDRTRRYETASSLAADIQHYLKGEPITVNPPGRPDRLQNMFGPSRLALAATAIGLVLILGCIGIWFALSLGATKKISRLPPPPIKEKLQIGKTTGSTTIPRNENGGTGGTLQITSGTGDFSPVSSNNKTLTVMPGENLKGTINLQALNFGVPDAIAPLIWTPSWGDHDSSWRQINGWIPTGQSTQQAQVSFTAPATPGIYHLIFAFAWEKRGDQVASGSIWTLGTDRWNDGNDIAELNANQIANAQVNGYTDNNWLVAAGGSYPSPHYIHQYVPADALTLIVTDSHLPVIAGAQAIPSSGVINKATSLSLPSGCPLYVYGFATGGGYEARRFASGTQELLRNASGNITAGLAISTDDHNSFTTHAAWHSIAGFGASGFKYVTAYYARNNSPGAPSASVKFTLNAPALVAVVALGGGHQYLDLHGPPELQLDATVPQKDEKPLFIAHAHLIPGEYEISESTSAAGAQREAASPQDPDHMADLLGIFIFSNHANAANSDSPHITIPATIQQSKPVFLPLPTPRHENPFIISAPDRPPSNTNRPPANPR